MKFHELIVFIYGALYLSALALAVWKRKSFPLAETLAVAAIVGLGFTALVYLVTLPLPPSSTPGGVPPSELIFTLTYLILIFGLLSYNRPMPAGWKGNFLKEKIAAIAYKLLVFVFIPLTALCLLWRSTWAELGFSAGDVVGQLGAASILILLFGGFNLVAGGGAAPIRARRFSARQVGLAVASPCCGTSWRWE